MCAPSQFCEDADAHAFSTGTSAACGIAGGVVAAIRTTCPPSALSPGQLREALRRTARKPCGPRWDDRLGYGVLDAAAAADEATKACPAAAAA
ncbi:MAG: S8 family serine peptidase [Microvirga sp.]